MKPLTVLLLSKYRYLEKWKYAGDNFITLRFSDVDSNLKLIVYHFSDFQLKFNLNF
jgi:hypothetical protein